MYRISSTINIYYSKGYIDNEDPQEGSEKQNCFYAVLIDNSSNDKLDNMLNPKFKSDVSIIDIRMKIYT